MDALAVLRLHSCPRMKVARMCATNALVFDGSLFLDPAAINRIGIEFFFEELGAAHRLGGNLSGSFGSKKICVRRNRSLIWAI
jgi:hypothetical protein